MKNFPLIGPYSGNSILGWKNKKPISIERFLTDVNHLSQNLLQKSWMLNICSNRYHFLVGFAAALIRGQTNILPPNKTLKGLQSIISQFPDIYCFKDHWDGGDLRIPCMEFSSQSESLSETPPIENIPGSHTAVIAFTSGSTGFPQPHLKSWESMVAIARNTGHRLIPEKDEQFSIVATVPPQHMYGLETSIMLPLQHNGIMHEACPFFPEDILDALESVPARRILVTTPLHLKACVESSVQFPEISLIISATAPLSRELTLKAEKAFNTQIFEIYGCTEAGSLATRQTSSSETWQLLDGIDLKGNHDQCNVDASYLPEPVLLPDIIKNLGNNRFELTGRTEDLINIGGKRISLSELNYRLNEIKGVVEASYFVPPQNESRHNKLVAFVVTKSLQEKDILQALRQTLDPVFLPRPLYFVKRLPRTSSGKITQKDLLDIFFHFSS